MKNLLRSVLGGTSPITPRVPDGVRLYAIGDIHGRLDLLADVEQRIAADARSARNGRMVQIFIGDYVDRGPDSKGVIDRLLAPPPDPFERVFLKGNHEAMLLDFLADANVLQSWQQCGGLETLRSYGIDLAKTGREARLAAQKSFLEAFPDHHKAFLNSLRLTAEFGDYLFVHAGVRPHRRLDKQRADDLLWIREEFTESEEDFGKVIVHGHSPSEAPEVLANRINIDTGAYATDQLTCLVLEGEERRFLTSSAA